MTVAKIKWPVRSASTESNEEVETSSVERATASEKMLLRFNTKVAWATGCVKCAVAPSELKSQKSPEKAGDAERCHSSGPVRSQHLPARLRMPCMLFPVFESPFSSATLRRTRLQGDGRMKTVKRGARRHE